MSRISFLSKLLIGALVIGLGAAAVLLIQNGHAQRSLAIEITSPKPGSNVQRETPVQGTARLPAGYSLWVLIRPSDARPLWWPQQQADLDPKTQQWSAAAVLGGAEDVERYYDIGAIAVEAKGNAWLAEYKKEALKTGNWKPVEAPPDSSPPQIVTVKKVAR